MSAVHEEPCVGCGKEIDLPGVVWFCDEEGGPFHPDCFERINCEERHGEGCPTQCFDDGKVKA